MNATHIEKIERKHSKKKVIIHMKYTNVMPAIEETTAKENVMAGEGDPVEPPRRAVQHGCVMYTYTEKQCNFINFNFNFK